MGFSLLLLWVWMKSPCCSAIRTGHSPVNLSQWAIHDFLYAMSNCYKHILSNYHSQSHLQMHIQSQIIWIIVFHWSISKHLRQYWDSFEWWKALPLGNVLDLFSLCILRCVLLTMALRVKSHSYSCILIQRRCSDGSVGRGGLFHRNFQKQLFYL